MCNLKGKNGLFKDGTIVNQIEVLANDIQDGDLLIVPTWDYSLIEEGLKAIAIARQYMPKVMHELPFECPRCAIINENLFSSAKGDVSRETLL